MHDPDPMPRFPLVSWTQAWRAPQAPHRADPSPDLVWWLEDPVREAVRPGRPLAPPIRLDEDGLEQLGLAHSLSRPG